MATSQDNWRLKGWFKVISAIPVTAGCLSMSGNCALAQSNIVPDDTLGAETSFVVPNFNGLPVEVIAGGAQRGQNLFHSFQEFNVSEGRGAYFFSPNTTIQNILARVTGANRSDILGVLGTFGNSGPNLFLINPNGIFFGRNASLNVGGSFFASTADSVVFDNDYQFSATNPQAPPLLTINVPLGLQYGANPGRIVNQSRANGFGLRVPPERALALVGGEVALEGGILFAPNGRIELGSVAGNNQVSLTPTSTGYALNYQGVGSFQDIRVTQRAFVATSGNSGGSVQVQGRNVTLSDGSQISANVLGAGVGGGLTINASESVQVIGRSADGLVVSALAAQAESNATGDAGDLIINTSRLLISEGAQVSTDTFGAGKGGNLIVNASDSVQVIGRSVDGRFATTLAAQADRNATGAAGDLKITTSQLLIQDGAQVSTGTFGAGKGGNLTVNAFEEVQVIGRSADGKFFSYLSAQSEQIATGDAGDLTITTSRLLINDGGQVSASTFGVGKGGDLTVNASDSVQVIGRSADDRFASALGVQTEGKGEAGDLSITTARLLISKGALVSAATDGAGKGGNLSITTSELLISEGALVSAATDGAGKGGNLTINASDFVQVIGTSANRRRTSTLGVAQAESNATGDAGNLTITTPQLLISEGGLVSASTFGVGKGGNLTVNTSEEVQVIGRSTDGRFISSLVAQAERTATGDAGNLTITTSELLIKDGAQVSASTFGAGKGGNLIVNASEKVQVIGRSTDDRFSSNLAAQAEGTGNAGDLSVTTPQLLIKDGAFVSASTFGVGKGGNLTVNASDSVQVVGRSTDGRFLSSLGAQADLNSTGDAGNLTITTSELLVKDGGFVSASTFGDGRGGNLTIITSELLISESAKVSASTLGAGKGGNLIVNASESVQLSGVGSGLFSASTVGGIAGNLSVQTRQMSVRDGAGVTVSSLQGQAGNMTIAADSLTLNRGRISAVTAKSTAEGGANITLQGLDLLRMDNESFISASAREDANGGNVTIDSTLIVATPPKGPQGSDIIANADRGNGGSINITTQGLFGIKFRPQRTPKNDITVSSNFGLAGVYTQTTPAVDPSRGLAELPVNVVDASQQIDRRCTPAAANKKSSFVITGRGGLPPSPNDVLQNEEVITPNWITLDSQEENTNPVPSQTNPINTAPKQLVEAQSWVYGPNGEVILVAEAPTTTPHNSWQTPPSCEDLLP